MSPTALRDTPRGNAFAAPADAMLIPWRFPPKAVAVRLFISCWLLYALHFATNTVREIYPALSLGDHLSFDVTEYAGLHPDIFALPGRGSFINSNPGASIVGALPYVLSRPIIDPLVAREQRARATAAIPDIAEYQSEYPMAREFYRQARARGLDVKFGLAAAAIQGLGMAPLSALSVVVMFWVLLALTSSVRGAAALAALYAFATPVFYRTAQLNQNLLVSHCTFFAFVLLWRPRVGGDAAQRPRYLLAGLLAGWAVVCDYSGVVVVAVLGAYAWLGGRRIPPAVRASSDRWQFAAGVTACIGLLMAYQWWCFGHPLYPPQHYMPPATYSHYGYAGMDWPHLDLLWATAFNRRFGLFVAAPVLLLSLYPPAWRPGWRLVPARETRCIAALCAAFFLFCSANQYGWMQFNSGVRHIVPVAPFLFLIAAGVLWRLPSTLAVCLGAVTTYWSWCLAMYRDVEQGRGVLEAVTHITTEGVRLPWLTTLERMGYVRGAPLALPLLALSVVALWALWSVGRSRPLS